jgi:hypothetical protein
MFILSSVSSIRIFDDQLHFLSVNGRQFILGLIHATIRFLTLFGNDTSILGLPVIGIESIGSLLKKDALPLCSTLCYSSRGGRNLPFRLPQLRLGTLRYWRRLLATGTLAILKSLNSLLHLLSNACCALFNAHDLRDTLDEVFLLDLQTWGKRLDLVLGENTIQVD